MPDCRYLAGLAADRARGHATSPARAGFLTRTCPCDECRAWRRARRVSVPPPYVAEGWFALRGSVARVAALALGSRLRLDVIESDGVVYEHPDVEVFV